MHVIELDFQQAKSKHLQFKSRLRSILFGEELADETPVVSQYDCPVGKWIYRTALRNYGHLPEIMELEKAHADLHLYAAHLVELYKQGKIPEAQKGLDNIETIAENLMNLFDKAEKKLLEENKNSIDNSVLNESADYDALLKKLYEQNKALDKKIQLQSEALLNQETFLKNLMEVSPSVLWMTDTNGTITYLSPTWFKWTGIKNESPHAPNWMDSIHLDDQHRVSEKFNYSLVNRASFEIEYKMAEREGKARWCLSSAQPCYDASGTYTGFTGSTVDITDLKIAEAEVLEKIENERKILHSFFMQAPAIFCILRGPQHVFELTNAGYKSLIGGRDVIGLPARQALPEVEGQGFFELLDNVYKTRKAFIGTEMPMSLIKENGIEICYFNFIYQPILNEQNITDGILVFANEITEQVMARKKIEESENRFRNMLKNAPVAIGFTKGSQMILENVNLPMLQLLHKKKDIIGKPLLDVMPELSNQVFIQYLNTVFETGEPYKGYELPFNVQQKEKTEERFYNISYTPIFEESKVTGILHVVIDVTDQLLARKKIESSEARFRLMADIMPQIVWTSDANGNLNYYNQAVFDYSGLSLEQIIENGWLQIVHPDEREENIQVWMESIETGKEFVFQHRFKNKEGNYRWQLSRAIPQRDNTGNILLWIGTSTDIHDQKTFLEQLELMVKERTQELVEVNYELERSNNELKQFAYVASHDLQEPLRKIMTYSNWLSGKYKELPEESLEYLSKINLSANRMSRLIRDVLDFSSTSKISDGFCIIDLDEIVRDIVTDFELEIQTKNAILNIGTLPLVTAIPMQMRQLFHNLLSNALKFSIEGKKQVIEVSSKKIRGNQIKDHVSANKNLNYWQIIFSDKGIGFDQKFSEQIFTIFQRLHGRSQYEGTGIGLALCRKIADNHNGFINAISIENEGATFHIYLPEKH